MSSNEQLIRIETFKNLLIGIATGGGFNDEDYKSIRLELLGIEEISSLLPEFTKTNRNCHEFWQFIKFKFKTYAERRTYIADEFSKLLDYIEQKTIKNISKKVVFNIEDYFNTEDEHFNRNAYYWYLHLKNDNFFPKIETPFLILYNYIHFKKNHTKPISCVDIIENKMTEFQLNKDQRLFIYDKLSGLIANEEPTIQDKLSTINVEILDRRFQIEPYKDLSPENYSLEHLMKEADKIHDSSERIKFLRQKQLSYKQEAKSIGWDIGFGDEIQIEIEHLERLSQKGTIVLPKGKSKILFLGANPKDSTRLRVDEEIREIEMALKVSKERDNFILLSKWAVTPSGLQQAILDDSPDVIHFSGHGSDKGIVLEDNNGHSKIVSESALESLFELFSDKIKCIILNSCYSEVQAKAIAKHIPFVIGMDDSITDETAIIFSVGFYKALGAGRDVEFAFKLGVNAIDLQGVSGGNIPKLIINK